MFVNLTPHAITLQAANGTRHTIQPSGTVARIDTVPGEHVIIEGSAEFPAGVAIHAPTQYGQPVNLPEPKDGVTYIVSAMFAGRVGNRCDVVHPGTGPDDGCIREKGQVVAVTRLIQCGRTHDDGGISLTMTATERQSLFAAISTSFEAGMPIVAVGDPRYGYDDVLARSKFLADLMAKLEKKST